MGAGRKSLSMKAWEQNWSRALPGYNILCGKVQWEQRKKQNKILNSSQHAAACTKTSAILCASCRYSIFRKEFFRFHRITIQKGHQTQTHFRMKPMIQKR